MKKTVLIGIQARTDSNRLPNKAHLRIGNRAILQVVIDACQQAVKYLNKHEAGKMGVDVQLALLVPAKDQIVDIYKEQLKVIEGDHDDVLSRYVNAAKSYDAHYITRITGDCLYIPSHLIVKHVKSALIKEKDYTTNVHYRTFREGYDCEVLSRRLLEWIDTNADAAFDREHVTTLIAADKYFPFKDQYGQKSICHIMMPEIDESHIKTSIDTKAEYDAAVLQYQRIKVKRDLAKKNGFVII